MVKLLNSLSTNADVLELSKTTVNDAGTIIRFNLDDLNWTTANWESLVAVYPYAIKPDGDRFGFQRSFVSQNNRLIERHSISTGYFWTS